MFRSPAKDLAITSNSFHFCGVKKEGKAWVDDGMARPAPESNLDFQGSLCFLLKRSQRTVMQYSWVLTEKKGLGSNKNK